MKSLELILSHDGENWICNSDILNAIGRDFNELDIGIINQLKNHKIFNTEKEINILMKFDFDQFPMWLRQYQSHYFNREVILNLEDEKFI